MTPKPIKSKPEISFLRLLIASELEQTLQYHIENSNPANKITANDRKAFAAEYHEEMGFQFKTNASNFLKHALSGHKRSHDTEIARGFPLDEKELHYLSNLFQLLNYKEDSSIIQTIRAFYPGFEYQISKEKEAI